MSESDNKNDSIPEVGESPAFHPRTGLWFVLVEKPFVRASAILIVLIVVSLGVVTNVMRSNASESNPAVISPRGGGDNRTVLFIDGNRNNMLVEFSHEAHKESLGGNDSCVECHHIHKPGDFNTACWQCHTQMEAETPFFNHAFHEAKLGDNQACEKCHDPARPNWITNAKQCSGCHEQDMHILPGGKGIEDMMNAPGYVDAMHGMCTGCHEKKSVAGPTECAGCHGDDNVGQ